MYFQIKSSNYQNDNALASHLTEGSCRVDSLRPHRLSKSPLRTQKRKVSVFVGNTTKITTYAVEHCRFRINPRHDANL